MPLQPIRLRPETAGDEAFLFTVYASARQREMDAVGWDEPTRQSFLRMQFQAMRRGYASTFPRADFSVILRQELPVGRIVVHRAEDEIRLVDLALLPQHREQGIGTLLMRKLMDETAAVQKPLRLRVDRDNRAVGLYRRLGFLSLEEEGPDHHLEWRPRATSTGSVVAD